MRTLDEVISIIPELTREDLDRWINDALVESRHGADNMLLTDAQYARVRFICTLRYDMDVQEEVLPVILDLVDQLHETRHRLYRLGQAVLAQDAEVKSSIVDMLCERQHLIPERSRD